MKKRQQPVLCNWIDILPNQTEGGLFLQVCLYRRSFVFYHLKEKKGAKCKRPSRHDDDVVVDPCLLLMSLFILYPSSSSFSTLCHLSWQSAKERIWCPWIPTACRILTSKLDSSPTRTTSRKRPRPSKRRSTRSGTKRSHCKCVLHLRVLHYFKKTFVFF